MVFEGVIDVLKSVHGETIVYKGDGDLSHFFTGVFDETYVEVDPDSGNKITSQTPSILLSLPDLPEQPVRGKKFLVRGVEYFVRNFEPDGKGSGRAFLTEED